MNIVYQSNRYSESRITGVYARKIAPDTLRIFEVSESATTIREYDIVAVTLIANKRFDEHGQERLTPDELTILNRIATIDCVLSEL